MPTYVRTQEIAHDIGPDGRFSLRVTSPDVELRATDATTATVRVQFEIRAPSDADADQAFERLRFDVHQADGLLEVGEPRQGERVSGMVARILGMRGDRLDVSVSAEVPAGATLVYQGVSSDLTASGFTGEQQYRTVSGDLVLDRVAGAVRVNGVSSDVSIRADAPTRLEANTVSGDLSAAAPRLEGVRVVTVSGDVELDGQLAPGAAHRIETVSGDLSLGIAGGLALEVRGLSTEASVALPHRTEGSRDRRRFVIGDGGAELLFSSMSGDVVVHASRRFGAPATPPTPPAPPRPPVPAAPPKPAAVDEATQLAILRALERGDIDVDEAARRLAGEAPDA
ncbi:MAG TPA: DUF4097 family beta strand repeat-containing protein [Candidatus Limnocylindria bacterium]|nr:DUF4097 family beta strand repeat-containing protein [Candidatus Limnocylindria bacterium]